MKFNCVAHILYISLIVIISETAANENEESQLADELVVKPLINYIETLRRSVESNQINVAIKEAEIMELKEKLVDHFVNVAIIKELRDQIDFYRKCFDRVAASNMPELKAHLEAHRKRLDQKDQRIPNIQNDVKEFEKKLKSFNEKPSTTGCADFGNATGIHQINVSNYSFAVLCDSETAGPGWTVIQKRISGGENFDRDWATYREGFGSFKGDFFLGLEKIHQLTSSQPHELHIQMKDFYGIIKYASYQQFGIADESDKYRLINLSEMTGDASFDALVGNKAQKFSTFDSDNDDYAGYNCAQGNSGGWWYSGCGLSHLNAKHQKSNGIVWGTTALQSVKMLIRPVKI